MVSLIVVYLTLGFPMEDVYSYSSYEKCQLSLAEGLEDLTETYGMIEGKDFTLECEIKKGNK